jgi:hypothetical protein
MSLSTATRELANLFRQQPGIAQSVSRMAEIAPSARMIFGMSACGEPGDLWLEAHLALEAGRDERRGYGAKFDHHRYFSQDHEPVEFFRYSEDNGESGTLYFWFDPSKMDAWEEGPEACYDDEEVVEGWLASYYGVGEPCGCAVCNAGGDCCGRWFAHSLDIWPAQFPRRVNGDDADWSHDNPGNWRWYGRVRFSRNI